MNLNLKNARRLEQSIEAALNDAERTITCGVKISVYDEHAETSLDFAIENLVDAINHQLQLTELRYKIRAAIGTVNETSGLNALMAKEKNLSDQLHLLLTVVNRASLISDSERQIILRKLESKRDGKGTSSYMDRGDEVDVGIAMDTAMYSDLKTKVQVLKRKKAEMADEMSRLNLTETITISDADVKLLEKYSLV